MPPKQLSKSTQKLMEQIRSTWVIPKKKTADVQLAVRVLGKTGKLRAGIDLSNSMLSKSVDGVPQGFAPDLVRALGRKLGLEVAFVPYANSELFANGAEQKQWDVGLLGVATARSESIIFSSPCALVPATYMVKPDSPIKTLLDVDRAGVRVAVSLGSTPELWLSEHLRRASLVKTPTPQLEGSWEAFLQDDSIPCLAGTRPWLTEKAKELPNSKLLAGAFTLVNYAIGIPRCLAQETTAQELAEATAAIQEFVKEGKTSGSIQKILCSHNTFGPHGLVVAAP